MLTIRYFQENDKKEMISLLQAIFPKKVVHNYADFWEWQYLSNPNEHGATPAIILSELHHKIVGILAGVKSKLKVGNSCFDCLWLVDYGTHPDYRFKAGAFKLAHRAMQDFDILLGFANSKSSLVGERIGFSYFSVPVLTNVLSIKNILSNKSKESCLTKRAESLWGIFKKLYLFKKNPLPMNLLIEEISFSDDRLENFWNRIKEDYAVICNRNKDYLQWRYKSIPGYEYKTFGAIIANELSGYVVLRVENRSHLKTGLITELLCLNDKSGTAECLIRKALSYFHNQAVDVVKCFETGISRYDKTLRRLGFFHFRRKVDFFVKSTTDKIDQEFLARRKNWYLSIGDSDLDFFEFY